jgi:hypothetical protein
MEEARGREEEEDARWGWGRDRAAEEAELEAAGHLARVGSHGGHLAGSC